VQVTIRAATIADAPAISALVCKVAREKIFADGPEEGCKYFMAMNTPAATVGKMGSDAYRYYLAELDGQVVGVVAMLNNAQVYHLFVDSAQHGKGIGRKLWEHAREECLKRGNPGRFSTDSTLDAVSGFQRFGFKVSGEQRVRNGHPSLPMTLDYTGRQR
jgi:N-acetylglutamate synthase-like GNAT family acetyltransferase